MIENLNTGSLKQEHIQAAYDYLKAYCDQKNVSVVDFVSNPLNIPEAVSHIHKNLPFAYRMLLSKDKLQSLIQNNIEFIKTKAQELSQK